MSCIKKNIRRIVEFKNYFVLLIFSLFYSIRSIAEEGYDNFEYIDDRPSTLGSAAKNISNALMGISDLWLAVASIAGLGLIVASIAKFHMHRKNPQQIPIGQPISLLVIGMLLLSLSFIAEYGDTSYTYIKRLL